MDSLTSGESTAEAKVSFDTPHAETIDATTEEHTGPAADDEYWRQEVAARLQRYRTRRKVRAPRYPSLRLPFDAAERNSRAGEFAPPVSNVQSF